MACRYTYQGKTYQAWEFEEFLKTLPPSIASAYMPGVESVPNAPFVGKTEGWMGIAAKRMLRYSAENGYDSLAWTPGSVQAERYDLSRQISKVVYDNGILNAIDHSGDKVIAKDVPAGKLADYIGKDAADKLIAMQPDEDGLKALSGLDLKVGGEGMKGFYDQILPAFLNKYGKKWGAKVGTTQVYTGITGYEDDPDLGTTDVIHSFPITESMKRSVLTEGQALFENEQHSYALRQNEPRQVNLDLAKAALGDLDRTQVLSSTGRTLDRPGVPARTLALGISPDLIHQGVVDLTGYEVRTAEDLAKLAQVYRDPRFETFRIFYVKGTTVVGHEGLTSRLPGLVMVFKNEQDAQAKLAAIDSRIDALGATGYYLLHNHPSGNSSPSQEDFKMTERIAMNIPGFKGHVIIDSNQYDTITFNDTDDLEGKKHTLDLGPDRLLTPALPNPLLGSPLDSPEAVAAVGQKLKSASSYATVLYRSGGHGGSTRAIQEVSVEFLADQGQAATYLQQQAVAFGASQIFVHYGQANAPGSRSYELAPVMDDLIMAGIVMDYVTSGTPGSRIGSRLSDDGVRRNDGMVFGRKMSEIDSEIVADTASSYTSDDLSTTGSTLKKPTDTGMIDRIQAKDRLAAAAVTARPYLLGALGLNQLATVYGKDHREVAAYNAASQQMETDFVEITRASDEILKHWDALKVNVADRMARVMEQARFANYDPDPLVNTDAPEKPAEQAVRTAFNNLPPEAKEVYREARDFYANMADQRFDAIEARIERAGGTPDNRKAALDKLRWAYDQVRAKVYFPFTRFGDHIVIARQMVDGIEKDREVSAFESPLEAQQFATLMKARGWKVKQTTAKEYSRDSDGAASRAVREILNVVNGIDETATSKRQLLDAINQTFINSLPDMSYAKHFTHAKDVKGFSKDALRAFAHSAMHGAHHISRIQNADKLTGALASMDSRINETDEGDVTEARQVYNELTKRHNGLLDPNTYPVTAWLGQLGFTMSLGGVVATGITNATQVPLVTFPWLGSRYGFGKAGAELGRAYKDFLDPKTLNSDSLFDASQSKRVTEPERAMLKELQRRGRIDLTQTMDLSGRASQDNLSRVARQHGSLQDKMAKMLGFTFHAPEVMNRQVTALATYRMEMTRNLPGETTDQKQTRAINQAESAIIDTHFIYSQENRPRYMSGNVMRVLTMFKQYGQNIAFLYGRAAQLWLTTNQATAEERAVAKKQLLSMAGLQFAAAGALGMPFVGTVASLFTALLNGFGDDDDKKDWEVELRKLLAESFGKDAGEVLSHGASRLTPWDMAARLGQSDLFFRAPQREREGRAAAMDWITSLSGPVLGYAVNAYLGVGDLTKGIQSADSGHFLRGVEEMTPAVIRNGVKALRYELEGGIETRDKHHQLDLDGAEKLGQFFGFAPSRGAEMYEGVTAIKNVEKRLATRRADLLDQYAAAYESHDQEQRQAVLADVRAFNAKHRELAINGDTLMKSLKGRMKRERETVGGVYLPRKREGLRQEGAFANY